MSGCMSMAVKRSKRRSGRRMSPAMKKQASTVKRLAAHYRSIGRSVPVTQMAKQAAKINKGKMKMPSSRKSTKKSKRKTKRKSNKKGSRRR
jgi:hypothetical protein